MISIINFFLIYNFYIFIVLITGFAFKKIFWTSKSDQLTLGEIGIFGFLFVYTIVTIFHFFLPINIEFSLTFYLLCFIFFLFELKNFKNFIKNWNEDSNLIFVTHYVVINELLNYNPNSGEIVISDRNYNIIGNLTISTNE